MSSLKENVFQLFFICLIFFTIHCFFHPLPTLSFIFFFFSNILFLYFICNQIESSIFQSIPDFPARPTV